MRMHLRAEKGSHVVPISVLCLLIRGNQLDIWEAFDYAASMSNLVADTDKQPTGTKLKKGKRAQQRERTRARLLEVALKIFAARGFEGTSVRDIASAADVNHGMIKYYFKNKDQLWRSAVAFLFERMESELYGEHSEDQGVDELTQTKNRLRRYVRYCARHPEHARIMVQESIRDNDRLRWAVDTFISPQHDAARKNRMKSAAKGIWPDIPEASLAYIIVAAAQMPFVLAPELRHLYDVDMFEDKNIEAHADALITMLLEHKAPTSKS